MALQTNSEAYLPVMLSLIKLHIRSIWHTMMGGEGGLTLWPIDGTYNSYQTLFPIGKNQRTLTDSTSSVIKRRDTGRNPNPGRNTNRRWGRV